MKLKEGLYVVLKSNANVYASLFDFTEPWKIDVNGVHGGKLYVRPVYGRTGDIHRTKT